ncbi:MAG: TIGR03862 family flavoprotein [Bdellovibrionales bacterium]|nr:TIGR03862 family flavoprotein [Bdellovibrionales bacterium]
MAVAKAHHAKKVAIYGSGPAALMAASRLLLAAKGEPIDLRVFEKRGGFGRKLLIAGSSGLNISHAASLESFVGHYRGFTPEIWGRFFKVCSPQDWIQFVENLGLETFVGTSGRYFVREMKASGLLRAWIDALKSQGVVFESQHEWKSPEQFREFDAVGLFLGGGSWEESLPAWPQAFKRDLGVDVREFYPQNVGYEVAWSEGMIGEAEGKPLKNIMLKTKRGEKAGELVVTRYGLEGTPIYFLGEPGPAEINLKPSMSRDRIRERLQSSTENLSPIRRVKKYLQLPEASMALLFHHLSDAEKLNMEVLIHRIVAFPIELLKPRPLLEAISSGGGVALDEVSAEPGSELMLKKHPSVFCGGEMLDWSAPTGGFLIQGCVTQGAVAGQSIWNYITSKRKT